MTEYIYFKDMHQRGQIGMYPKYKWLVFRYPFPVFNADRVVLSHEGLLSEIKSGNCFAFVGAGFSIPCNGPSWGNLLKLVAELAAKSVPTGTNGENKDKYGKYDRKELQAEIGRYTAHPKPEGRSVVPTTTAKKSKWYRSE